MVGVLEGMKLLNIICIVCLLTSAAAFSFELTEKERLDILTMTDLVSEASENLDTKTLMSLLTKDIDIELHSSNGHIKNFDYSTYQVILKNMFKVIKSYKYENANPKIKKLSENRFKLGINIKQSYIINGNQHSKNFHQVWYLKYINTSLKAYKLIFRNSTLETKHHNALHKFSN